VTSAATGPQARLAGSGAAPIGYTYALPGGWLHLDLDPARRVASVRRAVSVRVRREPRLAQHVAQLDRLLHNECAVAAAGGAERVSLLAEATNDGIVTAAITFALVALAGAAVAPAPEALLDQLRSEQARARRDDPTATMAVARLAGIGLDRAAGVRREWTEAAPGGGRPRSRTWQLVLPRPGQARIGLLTLSSPSPALWPRLGPLFDCCGQTFRWTHGTDITGPELADY
jgi:hypothetical protein